MTFKYSKEVERARRLYRKQRAILFHKQWRRNNPLKIKAHQAVYIAKRNGTLKQLPCKQCGDPKSEAHHEDYSKPLDVIWLCKDHHVEADIRLRYRLKRLSPPTL